MDQQTRDLSNALASYRAYRRLDPTQRRIGDFINIVDSLFPPLSSSYHIEDILLAKLMSGPNLHGDPNAPANLGGQAFAQEDTLVDHKHLQRFATPSQAMPFDSPTPAAYPDSMRAASGTANAPVAKQLSEERRLYAHGNPNFSGYTTYSSTSNYIDPYTQAVTSNDPIPAPRFAQLNSAGQSMHPHSAYDVQLAPLLPSQQIRPRPRPRPRPPPPSSTAVVIGQTAAAPPAPTPVDKGKGRAVVTAASPSTMERGNRIITEPPTTFIGSGITNHVHFRHGSAGPSNLRLKGLCTTPETPLLQSSYLQTKSEPKPDPGAPRCRVISIPASILRNSGRPLSPIDLCTSSEHAESDDDVEIMAKAQLSEGDEDWYEDDQGAEPYGGEESEDGKEPDEVEGFEEAYHRATSSGRSSSPPAPADIIIKGGDGTMIDEELEDLLSASRHSKLWLLVEKGLIIMYIFGPDAPVDRYPQVLVPFNPRRPGKIYLMMQRDVFKNSRKGSAIAQASSKILLVYKDIKYLVDVLGYTFDSTLSEREALGAINVVLQNARQQGAPLTTITTVWEIYIWMKHDWYTYIDSKLGNHPNFQTNYQRRSGRISPLNESFPGSSTKGKEKRARDDDNPLSPRPKAAVRPRPNRDIENTGSMHFSSEPVIIEVTPTPSGTRSHLRNTAGVSTPVPPNPLPSGSHPYVKAEVPAKSLPTTIASVLATTTEVKDTLVGLKQAQFDVDMKNIEARRELVVNEQVGMDEERIHRMELEEERATREAFELEEKVNQGRRGQFIDQCFRLVNAPKGVFPEDMLEFAMNSIRDTLKMEAAMNSPSHTPRLVSRSFTDMQTRRAASVTIPPLTAPPTGSDSIPPSATAPLPVDNTPVQDTAAALPPRVDPAPIPLPLAPVSGPSVPPSLASSSALRVPPASGISDQLPAPHTAAAHAPGSPSPPFDPPPVSSIAPGPLPPLSGPPSTPLPVCTRLGLVRLPAAPPNPSVTPRLPPLTPAPPPSPSTAHTPAVPNSFIACSTPVSSRPIGYTHPRSSATVSHIRNTSGTNLTINMDSPGLNRAHFASTSRLHLNPNSAPAPAFSPGPTRPPALGNGFPPRLYVAPSAQPHSPSHISIGHPTGVTGHDTIDPGTISPDTDEFIHVDAGTWDTNMQGGI